MTIWRKKDTPVISGTGQSFFQSVESTGEGTADNAKISNSKSDYQQQKERAARQRKIQNDIVRTEKTDRGD